VRAELRACTCPTLRGADRDRSMVSRGEDHDRIEPASGHVDCHLSWVDLSGIARYKREFAFYAPDAWLTLEMPSPFLRSMPSRLIGEGGEPGTADAWARDEIVSCDDASKRELIDFHHCVRTGRAPRTSGTDGLADIRLCEAVARAHLRSSTSGIAAPGDGPVVDGGRVLATSAGGTP
jgi:predicted dehydrogenase